MNYNIAKTKLEQQQNNKQRIIIKNFMNLALFLHHQKENKNQSISLPIAPVYILPHQRWYFSSISLSVLRKRKQNTNFHKYVKELQQSEDNKRFICFYQKMTYFQTKLKHVFDTIMFHLRTNNNFDQYYQCQSCSMPSKTINYGAFKINLKEIKQCMNDCKKIKKKEINVQEDNNLNWYQFTKKMLNDNLNVITNNISQEALYIYKLPSPKLRNQTLIFSILWNNNYIIFNNQTQFLINKHMKSKAINLCQLLYMRIQESIKQKLNKFCEENINNIEQIGFRDIMAQKLKINKFKVWFYKNDQNNQIYILNLTDLSFKGVICSLYDHFFIVQNQQIDFNTPKTEDETYNMNNSIERKMNKQYYNNQNEQRMKCKSYSNNVHNTIDRQLQSTNKLIQKQQNSTIMIIQNQPQNNILNKARKKYLSSQSNNDSFKLPQQRLNQNIAININKQNYLKNQSDTQQLQQNITLTDIQCNCCRNLLQINQFPNQIIAKHIEEIRYLRQIKIGKDQYNPYEFIKVCSKCYTVFMKHYKQNENKFWKKSLKDKSQSKNSRVKENNSFLQDKTQEISRVTSNKKVYIKRIESQSRNRPKSQFRHKYISITNKVKQRCISMKTNNPIGIINPKTYKKSKNKTTKTYNTEYSTNLRDQGEINKTNIQQYAFEQSSSNQYYNKDKDINRQQKQNPLRLKSQSAKLKPKTQNLINKILSIKQDYASVQAKSIATQKMMDQKKAKRFNEKSLMYAISQYQQLQRPNFKKIFYKSYKNGILRDKREIEQSQLRHNNFDELNQPFFMAD